MIADLDTVDLATLDALVLSPGVPLNTHPLAARARAASDQSAESRNTTGSAEREANTVDDDQPLSTRDIQDPNSKMTTPRDSPVPGEPNPLGPNVSTTPPN